MLTFFFVFNKLFVDVAEITIRTINNTAYLCTMIRVLNNALHTDRNISYVYMKVKCDNLSLLEVVYEKILGKCLLYSVTKSKLN